VSPVSFPAYESSVCVVSLPPISSVFVQFACPTLHHQSTMSSPIISPSGARHIQTVLNAQAETLPGCFLTVVSPTEVLFNSASGKFDVLDASPDARKASTEDVMWFASTTKLITSVCTCS
jgi:hypothetical protein